MSSFLVKVVNQPILDACSRDAIKYENRLSKVVPDGRQAKKLDHELKKVEREAKFARRTLGREPRRRVVATV